jgi:hypothetical protein
MWSQTWIWQHAWHVIVGVGCFVLWWVFRALCEFSGTYWQYKDQTSTYDEEGGRERIMESYDLDHPDK